MWKYLRERQCSKWVGAYLVFILLNYIVCLAPIGASYYFSKPTVLLSSFLAYCFTILAVTGYSFISNPKEGGNGKIVANLGIAVTIVFMVGYIICFILYNVVGDVTNILSKNIGLTTLVALSPVLILTLVISVPVIRLQVAADKPKKVIHTITEAETEGDRLISEISEKGIS